MPCLKIVRTHSTPRRSSLTASRREGKLRSGSSTSRGGASGNLSMLCRMRGFMRRDGQGRLTREERPRAASTSIGSRIRTERLQPGRWQYCGSLARLARWAGSRSPLGTRENRHPAGVPSVMAYPRLLQLVLVAAASAVPLASGVSEAKLDRPATNTGKPFAQMAPDAGGFRRFAQIRPGLARGGEPGEEGLQYLRDRGYRTIVSFLTNESESARVVGSGMQYVHIPMRSGL